MKILVIGRNGMIGNGIYEYFKQKYSTYGTIKKRFSDYSISKDCNIFEEIDLANISSIESVINNLKPNAVINCCGIIKQKSKDYSDEEHLYLNGKVPHLLLEFCIKKDIRLINLSTDCVFDGKKGFYNDTDIPNAADIYGISKAIGEIAEGGCLTIRTSTIGLEVDNNHGLIEWFLSQKEKEIRGYNHAIYSGLTIMCAMTYWLFGMSKFDSLTHSMTTIATGGFSNYNNSIGHFNNALIEINAVIFIILGSIPFIAYIKYLNGDKKVFYSDSQINFFIKTIIISVIIIFIFLLFKNIDNETYLLRQVIFNVVSILTGTGYVTTNYSDWGGFPLIFFLILMFIGGCAGSTACGLKIFRIHILYKFFVIQLKKYIYPRGVFVLKYGDNVLNEKFISSIISFVFLYIIIFFIITTLLSVSGLDFLTSVSGAATSISNVGPGLGGIIGPNGNFSQLPDFSKWILTIGMILGRLELFAIIVLFIPSFWRRY